MSLRLLLRAGLAWVSGGLLEVGDTSYPASTLPELVAVRNFFISQGYTPPPDVDAGCNRYFGDLLGYYNPAYPTENQLGDFAGLWALVGGTSATHRLNWVAPTMSASDGYMAIPNGVTHSAGGIQGNGSTAQGGTNQYVNLQFVPSVIATLASGYGTHVYVQTTAPLPLPGATGSDVYDIGCVDSSTSNAFASSRNNATGIGAPNPSTTGGNQYAKLFGNDQFTDVTNGTKGLGLHTAMREGGTTNNRQFHNGGQVGVTATGSGTLPTRSAYGLGLNTAGGPYGLTTRKISLLAIVKKSQSPARVLAFSRATQALQVVLGRAV